jgi:hypothetical protein
MIFSLPSSFISTTSPETLATTAGLRGHAALEDFFNARQALGYVAADRCGAAGVLDVHGQLRARLADGLCGNGAHRLAQATGFMVPRSAP